MAPGATETGVVAQGTAPLPLDRPDRAWIVVEGSVDVFASTANGVGRHHLFSAEPGDLLPPAPEGGDARVHLVAVGVGSTRLRPIAARELSLAEHRPALERLVASIAPLLTSGAPPPLQEILEPGAQLSLARERRAAVRERVVWVRHVSGRSRLAGSSRMELGPEHGWVPMFSLWLAAVEPAELVAVDTARCQEEGGGGAGVELLVGFLRARLDKELDALDKAAIRRRRARAEADRKGWERALVSLHRLIRPHRGEEADAAAAATPLLAACRAVGAASAITFQEPPRWEAERLKDVLPAICRVSRVRMRRVALRGPWYRNDAGPLLGYREEGKSPVALLPTGSGAYEAFHPATGSRKPVTAESAAELAPFAYSFYRPLADGPRRLRDLLGFARPLVRNDAARIGGAALASGLLGLALPVATAQIFNQVIPNAQQRDLLTFFIALLLCAASIAVFDIVRGFALTRCEGRVAATLQAALVDRLLALPVPFFRRYAVGDLSQRAAAIPAIQDPVGAKELTTILTSVFAAVNFFVLFYYDWRLALLAAGLLAIAGAVHVALVVSATRLERRHLDQQGRVAGMVLQMLSGIGKLRVTGAEGRAFSVWSKAFTRQRELAHQAGERRVALNVFNEVLPVAAAAALYGCAGWLMFQKGDALRTGDFVAFSTAFAALFAAAVALTNTASTVIAAVPILERTAPILESGPEVTGVKTDPGPLQGEIEGTHLSFRYQPNGPLVLDDVSFRAEPGQFVAFVGASGSGKSTTLRLLLGFETPESGAVYYDGQDVASLDLSAIRSQQIGVVLQTSRLLSGDILSNIVGTSELTLEDAWAAAEMSGLADDIRDMALGMHTVVSEGGTTLSGGQRQRLLIARALVRKPRIVLFDEATSALDNRTQETVTRTLELMSATRFVIAHRLSTIRKADRIYVMDHGRVVEEGAFDELAKGRGLFSRLVARQQA